MQRLPSVTPASVMAALGQEPTLPSGCYRAASFVASLPNAGAVEFSPTMPRPTDTGLRRIGCASVVL